MNDYREGHFFCRYDEKRPRGRGLYIRKMQKHHHFLMRSTGTVR